MGSASDVLPLFYREPWSEPEAWSGHPAAHCGQ